MALAIRLEAGYTDADAMEASFGKPEAFRLVFDRHFGAVYRFAAARLGPAHADDVASQTFLIAFAERRRYDVAQPSARPWLMGVAANVIRRHHREEATRLRALARETAPSSSERGEGFDVRGELATALLRLDPDQRESLLLLALGELSYREIARALGVPEGTVRSRIHRARKTLQEVLDR